jgi:hypothetical protein
MVETIPSIRGRAAEEAWFAAAYLVQMLKKSCNEEIVVT